MIEEGKEKKASFERALECTEYGKFNLALTIISGLCLFGSNAEMYSVSYILSPAECDLNLDTSTKGLLGCINFLGILVSSFLWGYLSDTKGRKKIIIGCLMMASFCTLCSAFAPNFWSFTLFRFLNGFFICGPSSVIFAYIGEFHSIKNRARAVAWASLLIGLSLTLLPAFAWIMLSQKFSFQILTLNFRPWRAFILICGLPSLVVLLGFLWFPESPKLLFHNGQPEKSLEILKKIYTANTGKSGELYPVEELNSEDLKWGEREDKLLHEIWRQCSPLFRKPHHLYTIVLCLIQFGNFSTSSGLFMWYPDILNQLSGSEGGQITVCEALANVHEGNLTRDCNSEIDSNVFQQNMLIGFTYLIGYSLWGIVVNLLGNLISLVISAIATASLCLATQHILIDVLFITIMVLPGISVAVVNTAIVDIFPTNLCGMAMCLSMMFGRVGSILSSSFVGILLEFNCNFTFLLYSGSIAVCILLSFTLPRKPLV